MDSTLKAVHDAQQSKWFDGSMGHAISWPYRVKRYLSPALSEKIRAEIQVKCAEWIEALESTKPSQRVSSDGHYWNSKLEPQHYTFNDKDENAIPTQVLGHKVYVKILTNYRKGNGQWGVKSLAKPVISFNYYINRRHIRPGDWHTVDEARLTIGFDEEKQLYYICEYHRAENKPLEKISGKNWGRTAKRREFMSEVRKLEDSLTKSGVTIGAITKMRDIYKFGHHGLEEQFISCEGTEVTA